MNTFDCQKLIPCSGLIMAKTKTQRVEHLEKHLISSHTLRNYKVYKKLYTESGIFRCQNCNNSNNVLILDYIPEDNLRYVKIVFDVEPYYDRVTKDRAAKPVDMLSAIGGTMGLLTGFSLISGAEIVYFAVKIILGAFCNICKKKREKKKA